MKRILTLCMVFMLSMLSVIPAYAMEDEEYEIDYYLSHYEREEAGYGISMLAYPEDISYPTWETYKSMRANLPTKYGEVALDTYFITQSNYYNSSYGYTWLIACDSSTTTLKVNNNLGDQTIKSSGGSYYLFYWTDSGWFYYGTGTSYMIKRSTSEGTRHIYSNTTLGGGPGRLGDYSLALSSDSSLGYDGSDDTGIVDGSGSTSTDKDYGGILDTIVGWLKDIFDSIVGLPGKLLDGIKEIFIPDTAEIDKILDDLVSEVEGKFGFNTFDMDSLFSKSSAPENVIGEYKIYGKTYTLTFADFSFLATGVEFFRPYVRGFLVLLLFLFNVRMAFSTFDLDSGISAGQVASMAKSSDKGDK